MVTQAKKRGTGHQQPGEEAREMYGRQERDRDEDRAGDRVRVRSGARGTLRGFGEGGAAFVVQLDSGEMIRVEATEATNTSRSTRRRWRENPPRAVGRRRLPVPRTKMVSFRLDIDLWERLGEAKRRGLIVNKERQVNSWLRELRDALAAGTWGGPGRAE